MFVSRDRSQRGRLKCRHAAPCYLSPDLKIFGCRLNMWHNWIQLDHASYFPSSEPNEVSAIKILLSKNPRDFKNHWLLTLEVPILWPENKNTCAAFQKQHNLPTVLGCPPCRKFPCPSRSLHSSSHCPALVATELQSAKFQIEHGTDFDKLVYIGLRITFITS